MLLQASRKGIAWHGPVKRRARTEAIGAWLAALARGLAFGLTHLFPG